MNESFNNTNITEAGAERLEHLDGPSRSLAADLDALASHDASANASALEASILGATMPIIAGARPARAGEHVHEAGRRAGQHGHSLRRALLRTASVLVLAVGVSVAWIGLRPATPSKAPGTFQPLEVDAMLAGLESLDGPTGMWASGGAAGEAGESSLGSWDPAVDIESLGGSL
ncbi:MAG: hypothetical protein MUE97_02965 [Phycisphaerales bacterium]|jgi:hypothetical protein|nr:hypothetical protein [Phycisphaerales bacterium]